MMMKEAKCPSCKQMLAATMSPGVQYRCTDCHLLIQWDDRGGSSCADTEWWDDGGREFIGERILDDPPSMADGTFVA